MENIAETCAPWLGRPGLPRSLRVLLHRQGCFPSVHPSCLLQGVPCWGQRAASPVCLCTGRSSWSPNPKSRWQCRGCGALPCSPLLVKALDTGKEATEPPSPPPSGAVLCSPAPHSIHTVACTAQVRKPTQSHTWVLLMASSLSCGRSLGQGVLQPDPTAHNGSIPSSTDSKAADQQLIEKTKKVFCMFKICSSGWIIE